MENTLRGSTNLGTQVSATDLGLEGLTTTFDSVWQSAGKGIYYVESNVERWGYPFFARIGGYVGAGWERLEWRLVAAAVASSFC